VRTFGQVNDPALIALLSVNKIAAEENKQVTC
jgi:hypothetical protein